MPERTLSSETVFTSNVFSLRSDRVRLPSGLEATIPLIRHPGSVVLLPTPDPGHIVLVRQYRYAIDRWTWELPAGTISPGETPKQAAIRECHEEIEKLPGHIETLGKFYPTPGYCNELMTFFRLTELTKPNHSARSDGDEEIETELFSLDEAWQLVRTAEAPDMKTALGLKLL